MNDFSPISLGDQIRSRETAGFVWTETVHQASLSLKGHAHEFPNFVFIVHGSFTETIRGRSHECMPLGFLIKPAGEVHSDRYGNSGACCLITEVLPQRESIIRHYSRILEHATYIPQGQMSVLAMQLYREFQTEDSASALAMEALTLELLAIAIRDRSDDSPSIQPPWLRTARELLHDRFAEPITLLSIAQEVGVHPAYLARKFRKQYHCTVGDYVRKLRLDHASRELSDPERSLAEIAVDAGFYDQSHFANTFRNYLHMTPSEFRSEIRKSYPKK